MKLKIKNPFRIRTKLVIIYKLNGPHYRVYYRKWWQCKWRHLNSVCVDKDTAEEMVKHIEYYTQWYSSKK